MAFFYKRRLPIHPRFNRPALIAPQNKRPILIVSHFKININIRLSHLVNIELGENVMPNAPRLEIVLVHIEIQKRLLIYQKAFNNKRQKLFKSLVDFLF